MAEKPTRNLALDLVRVTEAAALAAARHMGRGDKLKGDQAAVDAMRLVLNSIDMAGVIVIGEGEKDEAPMLYNGEQLGSGKGPQLDIAADPIDGTRLLALGRSNSISTVALADRGDPGPSTPRTADRRGAGGGGPHPLDHRRRRGWSSDDRLAGLGDRPAGGDWRHARRGAGRQRPQMHGGRDPGPPAPPQPARGGGRRGPGVPAEQGAGHRRTGERGGRLFRGDRHNRRGAAGWGEIHRQWGQHQQPGDALPYRYGAQDHRHPPLGSPHAAQRHPIRSAGVTAGGLRPLGLRAIILRQYGNPTLPTNDKFSTFTLA